MTAAGVALGTDELDDIDFGTNSAVMHQEPFLPNQRRLAYDLTKLQPVTCDFDLQLRTSNQVEAVTELLRHYDAPVAIYGNDHGYMVFAMVSSVKQAARLRAGGHSRRRVLTSGMSKKGVAEIDDLESKRESTRTMQAMMKAILQSKRYALLQIPT